MSKKQKNHTKSGALVPPAPFDLAATPAFARGEGARPFFTFKDICTSDYCIKKCSYEQLKSLTDKLRILSSLEWRTIETSPRETNGFELLPADALSAPLPDAFSRINQVMVFRFGGKTTAGRIVGHRNNDRFYVLFVDRDFTLYDHG